MTTAPFAPTAGGLARPLAPRELRLFQRLIEREAGIHLADSKGAFLTARLTPRLRELALDFAAYYALVESDEPERLRMLDLVCTHETHFFREEKQFELLESRVLPAWMARAEAGRRPRRVRVWSAGCATGEEPYSLAMCLRARFPAESGWEIEILATDLSHRALDSARRGVWPIEKTHEIPTAYLRAFMLRGTGAQAGRMKAGPEIRSLVRFHRLNLNADPFALGGRFDLIFCRNVLIYFDVAGRTRVLTRLLDQLEPGGYLFLGQAETVTGLNVRARSVGPAVYAAADGGPGG
jgi:chemotaxis protein methyltransferase CheR